MARNVAIVIVGGDGVERAVHRVIYGARMKVDEGDKVKRGQRLAEWDPYTRPIMSEVDGVVAFEDLVEGQSMTETADEATGITKRMVIDWRLNQRSATLQACDPHQGFVRQDRQARCVAAMRVIRFAVESIIATEPGAVVKAGDIIARISIESGQDPRHHRRSAARG